MADINQVITQGIGTPAGVTYFLTLGLGIGAPEVLGIGELEPHLSQKYLVHESQEYLVHLSQKYKVYETE